MSLGSNPLFFPDLIAGIQHICFQEFDIDTQNIHLYQYTDININITSLIILQLHFFILGKLLYGSNQFLESRTFQTSNRKN